MLILSIETTGPYASAALADEKGIQFKTCRDDYSHLQTISPMIVSLMEEAGAKAEDLTAIAVSRGPGSFTGLRIGVATAKGFAQIWNKPIAEVPTLDSFVYARTGLDESHLVCPIFDARRSQVYGAAFRKKAKDAGFGTVLDAETLIPESAIDLSAYLEMLKGFLLPGEKACFFGDGVARYLEQIEASGLPYVAAPEEWLLQRADNVALLGAALCAQGKLKDCYTAQPEYLRPAEAERKLKEKQQGK